MKSPKIAGKATTATAKRKRAPVSATKNSCIGNWRLMKSPIGWHFAAVGKETPMYIVDHDTLMGLRKSRELRKYKYLFWVAFIGMIAVYLSTLIK